MVITKRKLMKFLDRLMKFISKGSNEQIAGGRLRKAQRFAIEGKAGVWNGN